MYGLIYKHTCKINGRSYIGQTTKSMNDRWKEHLYNKKNNKFTNAIKKYGINNWEHEVLAYAKDRVVLDNLEIYFIEKFDSVKNGYNSKLGGAHGLHSQESKEKMSFNRKGIGSPHTTASKEKIRIALTGRRLSSVHKKNLSEAKKGKKLSKERIEQIRSYTTGNKNPNYGKKTSKESIDKMREKMGKKIFCKELNMTFSCSAVAAEHIGVKRCGIQRCLVKGGTSHGYTWVYI